MISVNFSRFVGSPGLSARMNPDGNVFVVGKKAGSSAPTTPPARTTDIVLTSGTVDSRVTYTGPAHLYWSQSGLLATSDANTWPLEYQNGVAIGRHLPEPATTNLQENCRAIAVSDNVAISAGTTLNADPSGAPDGGGIGLIPVESEYYLISQDVNGVTLVPGTHYTLSTDWQRLAFAGTTTAESKCRIWLGRDLDASSGDPFVFLRPSHNLVVGNYVFSWFAKAGDETNFPAGLGMIENGNYPYATSPVINEDGNTATRSASSVSISQQGDSQSITVIFSDQSLTNIPFSGASSVSLPFADFNWSEKYVTRIRYVNGIADFSPIDLTASTLDSRVTYTGPAHTYFDEAGNLLTSSANEWPVEYQNGVVIGRHEPEPESKNYAPDSAASDIGPPGSHVWTFGSGADAEISVTPSDTSSFPVINAPSTYTFKAVYSVADSAFLVAQTPSNATSDWQRIESQFSNDSVSAIRWYPLRQDAGRYLYQLCDAVPVGDFVVTAFMRVDDDNFYVSATQLEAGTVATSPIFNGAGEQNTREAASVTVTNPGGATAIIIHYSDDTTQTVNFRGTTATVPLSTLPWATRYITQITFSG